MELICGYIILLYFVIIARKNISKGEALQNIWLKSTYRVAGASPYKSKWNVVRVR